MRCRGTAAILAGLLALAAWTSAAAENADSKVADSPIAVNGNRHVGADMIRSYFPAPGGHYDAAALDAALKRLYATGLFKDVKIAHEGDRVACFVPSIEGADAHAGHTETSLVLALDASRVRHNERVTGVTTPLRELACELRRGGVAAVSHTGVLGDPTTATPEAGRDVLARLVADLCGTVERAFGSEP